MPLVTVRVRFFYLPPNIESKLTRSKVRLLSVTTGNGCISIMLLSAKHNKVKHCYTVSDREYPVALLLLLSITNRDIGMKNKEDVIDLITDEISQHGLRKRQIQSAITSDSTSKDIYKSWLEVEDLKIDTLSRLRRKIQVLLK